MDSYVAFWKGLILFAFLAWMALTFVVTIFGWRDVRDMFRALAAKQEKPDETPKQSRSSEC